RPGPGGGCRAADRKPRVDRARGARRRRSRPRPLAPPAREPARGAGRMSVAAIPARPQGRPPAWRGMVFVIVTEATLFAVLLAIGFVALQLTEYRELLREIHPSTDAYASSFFTITGLHGTHVVAGLLLLAWTQFFAWRGAYRSEEHVAVQTSALYWHFVHVV